MSVACICGLKYTYMYNYIQGVATVVEVLAVVHSYCVHVLTACGSIAKVDYFANSNPCIYM